MSDGQHTYVLTFAYKTKLLVLCAVYGLKPGGECLFQLSNQSNHMFTIHGSNKVDVTQTTLS
ncbi:hypothetical protein H5410_016558 [Solanum commersonii]|uniref:Uncharacterized protein n=1 Tax=Solanum commersonii TaxID=4109 RepID=A0A9J5ZWQ1_SOLCO|nr:hypothetical protein H5410_016558 [Solanum commersonii]